MFGPKLTAQTASSTQQLARLVSAYMARARGAAAPAGAFVLDGAKLTDLEVGSPDHLLPLWAWHADNLYRFGIRERGFGFDFKPSAEALLRVSVNLDRTDRAISEVMVFIVEALEDARQHLPRSELVHGAAELRGLVNQFTDAMAIHAQPATRQPIRAAA